MNSLLKFVAKSLLRKLGLLKREEIGTVKKVHNEHGTVLICV